MHLLQVVGPVHNSLLKVSVQDCGDSGSKEAFRHPARVSICMMDMEKSHAAVDTSMLPFVLVVQ